MLLLRSVLFNIAFYVVLVVMLIIGIPLMATPQQTIKNYARLWSRISLRMLEAICGIRIVYRGTEHIPPGGFILAAKHQSFLDVLALLPLAPRFVYVMKRELALIPLFGQLMQRGGMIAIDRSKGRAVMGTLIPHVRAVIGLGEQLIIFPEGTRRPPGSEPEYKSGVAHLYVGTGATCVPVALNSGLFWPRRSIRRFPGTLVVEVQPPIPPGLDKAAFQVELRGKIEAASTRLLNEARTEASGRD